MNEPTWRKSSYSDNGQCLELAEDGSHVLVRNSNAPDAGTLTLTRAQVAALVADIKAGRLDDLA